MQHRPTRFALTGILAAIMAGGIASAAFAVADVTTPEEVQAVAARPSRTATPAPTRTPASAQAPAATPAPSASTPAPKLQPKKAAPKKATTPKMPSGTTTATSFWDGQTASGRSMRFATLASPYWPLGTKVKITYRGRSSVGIVDDFGPAEWAVAQHDPPALVDLSELMMQYFTGARSETITAKFEVLSWGKGRSYRTSGTGYGTAMGAYAKK